MGIILVYDCTDENSFNNIRNWVKQIETHAAKDVAKVLVGNKADMEEERVITTDQGQQLADEYGLPFFETSAKSGLNIHELFQSLAKTIVATRTVTDDGTKPSAYARKLNPAKPKPEKDDGGCCK
jgi:Ras-related protein Rab-8A